MKSNPIQLALLLFLFPLFARSADQTEITVPSGWDLSATLALFRNLPFIDPSGIEATKGEVKYFHEETFKQENGEVYTNTYHFFRELPSGEFLKISITEQHHLLAVAEAEKDTGEKSFHKVYDLEQRVQEVDSVPSQAKKHEALSQLIGYVFTHYSPLLNSKAGEMARRLNYQKEGRFRPTNYFQPRVTYMTNSDGNLTTIRFYGLDTLLTGKGEPMDEKVFEMSVEPLGAAKVSLRNVTR